MDVRMPDGTIVRNVPAGTTKSELLRRLGLARAETAPAETAETMETAEAAEPPAPPAEPGLPERIVGAANEAVALALGAPVDLVNLALQQVGLGSSRPIGGSESIRQVQRFLIENPDVAAATAASVAVPPLAPGAAALRVAPFLGRLGIGTEGLLGLAARGGARFGPTVAAAGAGGGVGGAAEEAVRGGSPEEIARAGLRSAQEMAIGEAAGLGITTPLARVAAPALGAMSETGRRAVEFARQTAVPGEATAILGRPRGLPVAPADVAPGAAQRAIQGVVDTLLPSRAVTQSRRRAVVSRVLDVAPEGRANEVIRTLVRADTADAAIPRAQSLAEQVAAALGDRTARRLGFGSDSTGPRRFIARALEASPDRLRRKLGDEAFEDVLTVNLEGLIRGATREVGGRRIIDGERLLAGWGNLPADVRQLYPPETRAAVEGFGAFAAVSSRVPELARQGVFAFGPSAISVGAGLGPDVLATGLGATTNPALFGVGAGVAALTAKSLMNPRGWLNRWLTNERLPPEVVRLIGGQSARTATRALLSEDDE